MAEKLRSVITGEVQYSDEEREFLIAIDRYKRENNRPCPTWREVLAVCRAIGYRLIADREPLPVYTSRRGGAKRATSE